MMQIRFSSATLHDLSQARKKRQASGHGNDGGNGTGKGGSIGLMPGELTQQLTVAVDRFKAALAENVGVKDAKALKRLGLIGVQFVPVSEHSKPTEVELEVLLRRDADNDLIQNIPRQFEGVPVSYQVTAYPLPLSEQLLRRFAAWRSGVEDPVLKYMKLLESFQGNLVNSDPQPQSANVIRLEG